MNLRDRAFFLLLIALIPAIGLCQTAQKLKHAEILVSEGKYEQAIEKYMKLYRKDSLNYEVNLGLGILFEEYLFDEDAALPYLESAWRLTRRDTQPELMFALGKCRLHNEMYESALGLFKQALNYVTENAEGKSLRHQIERYIENCNTGSDYTVKMRSKRYRIKNAGKDINSHYADYAPVSDSAFSYLLFTSRRPENIGHHKDAFDRKYFEDIYYAEKSGGKFQHAVDLDAPRPIMEHYKNSSDHDAVVSATTDGKFLFFYKDNGLHICKWTGKSWSEPQRLPEVINVHGSYEPHATLSPDGKILIFSSNKTGGYGGLDLYMSRLQADGNWGPPENLGPAINTEDREDGAYFSHDGTELYFSSEGLKGYGGFDIFVSKFDGTNFGKPVNLEPPINSPNDDIYISFNRDKTHGLLASSRKGGYGDMDIYQFYEMDKPAWTACTEKEGVSKVYFKCPDSVYVNELALFDAGVSEFRNEYPYHYYWKVNDSVMPVDSVRFYNYFRKNGTYDVTLYAIVFSDSSLARENYCFTKSIRVIERPKKVEVRIEPPLAKDDTKLSITGMADVSKIDTTAWDVFKIKLDRIYFDVNKSNLRPDAIATLNENIDKLKINKKIIVKISAHTDTSASRDYNLKLSQKRAQSVISYLGKKGIGKNRILAVMHIGEDEQIARDCGTDPNCNERQHQLNRRVEFFVIGVQQAPAKKPAPGKKTAAKKASPKGK